MADSYIVRLRKWKQRARLGLRCKGNTRGTHLSRGFDEKIMHCQQVRRIPYTKKEGSSSFIASS